MAQPTMSLPTELWHRIFTLALGFQGLVETRCSEESFWSWWHQRSTAPPELQGAATQIASLQLVCTHFHEILEQSFAGHYVYLTPHQKQYSVQHARRLDVLASEHAWLWEDFRLKTLGAPLTHLKVLNIETRYDGTSLISILLEQAESLPRLTALKLEWSGEAYMMPFEDLSDAFPNLELLQLGEVLGIDCPLQLPTLRTLSVELRFDREISQGETDMSEWSLPLLEHLSLSFGSRHGDLEEEREIDLPTLISGFSQNLRTLRVELFHSRLPFRSGTPAEIRKLLPRLEELIINNDFPPLLRCIADGFPKGELVLEGTAEALTDLLVIQSPRVTVRLGQVAWATLVEDIDMNDGDARHLVKIMRSARQPDSRLRLIDRRGCLLSDFEAEHGQVDDSELIFDED